MSVITPPVEVPVWIEGGVPVRLVWRGRRFRVTDRPTPLREVVSAVGITHPLEPLVGWRFQGTAEDGDSRIFDVRTRGRSWELVAVYD